MKKASIIIVVLLSILGIGCKKIHCPAFPEKLAKTYFPYAEKMILSFSNNTDTSTYIVNDIYLSKEVDYPHNCDCACDNFFYFDTDNRQLYGDILIGKNEDYVVFSVKINSIYFGKEYKDVKLFSTEDYSILGDTLFLENPNGQKAVIVKGKGLVSYTTADGEEWKLVE